MISVITPVHKEIPWWNLRILAMCCQTYKDWEWIILDNSENAFVKEYIDEFFDDLQGVKYPECREKIKVYYEPFKNASLENGRIGKLKNRCVELSSAKDDDIIVALDYDDFINTRSLEYIDKAIRTTEADICRLDTICATFQDIDTGEFGTHDTCKKWCECSRFDQFKNLGKFRDFYISNHELNDYLANTHFNTGRLVDEYCKFDYGGIFNFEYYNIRKFDYPITIVDDMNSHFIGKRKVFDTCGGFCDISKTEDVLLLYRAATDYEIVYIPYPWISTVTMVCNKYTINSAVLVMDMLDSKEYEDILSDAIIDRYDKFGIKPVVPVVYDVN